MNKITGFIKKYYKTFGYGLVIALLAIFCISALISRNINKKNDTYMGRLVSIYPLYDDAPKIPKYVRAAYDSFEHDASVVETAEGLRDGVGAYSDDKVLTEQQQKDKAALEALIASNESVEFDITSNAKDRREKYKLNNISQVNGNVSVTVTPGGTGDTAAGNSGVGTATYASNANGTYLGRFLLTGYCPCVKCCGKTNAITASGALATSNHTIAADRRYAFGTKMIILGQVYTVEDRGGAINGNHIDVFFNTHSEALEFGTKYADVYLYTGSDTSTDNSSTGNSTTNNSNNDSNNSDTDNNSNNNDNNSNNNSNNDSNDEGSEGTLNDN